MASIDRTYTDSYQEYKKFKDWADTQYLTFFDGHKVRIGDYVYDRDEEDFDGEEISIMNTQTWMDVYLIQNCESKFVLDRLKDVYGEEYYEELASYDLTAAPPEQFKKDREVRIIRNKRTIFPIHNKPYGKGNTWWLLCYDNDFMYNTDTKRWIHLDYHYPFNTNAAHFKSIKALVRHLKTQYLPSGLSFYIQGRYTGEFYDVIIK